MKLHLIVNPAASSVTPRVREGVIETLAAHHELTVAETGRRGHATALAAEAVGSADAVVVLAGDGTLNEVANGLAPSSTPMAALPGGSTNVFARSFGVEKSPLKAARQLLVSLAAGSTRRIGMGMAEDRYFLFHVGMGFDAAVVGQVERRGHLKRYVGHALFAYATLDTWLRHYDRSRPRFSVHQADGSVVDDGYLVICMNTDPYTYLVWWPMSVAPEAGLDRALAVVTLRTLGLLSTTAVAASTLLRGGLLRHHPKIDYRPDVQTVTVKGKGPFPYQIDGDYMGDTTELTVRHRPDSLTMIVPVKSWKKKPVPPADGGTTATE